MIKHIKTTQEQLHGRLVQFEVYQSPSGSKPFRAQAYHGPQLLSYKDAKSSAEAMKLCKQACLQQLDPLAKPT